MNNAKFGQLQEKYCEALMIYVRDHSESALFSISNLSKEFMKEGLGPDDVINLHSVAMGRIVSRLSGEDSINAFHSSTEPLLEIMMNYALSYHGHVKKHQQQMAEYGGGEKARELEKLASVGMLLLGMTGEIINHMEAMKEHADMMANGGVSRAMELSQTIIQDVAKAQEMLKAAFLYSRKVSKRTEEKEMVDVNALLADSLDVVRNAVGPGSVIFQTNYKQLVKVHVNPVEMQQAMVNLLASAIDAIASSGSVMISSSVVENGRDQSLDLRIVSRNNGTNKRMALFSLPMTRENVGINVATDLVKRSGGTIDITQSNTGLMVCIGLPVACRTNDPMEGIAAMSRR